MYQCTVEGISMGWAIKDENGSNGCESEYTNYDTVNITRHLSCATDFNTTLLHLIPTWYQPYQLCCSLVSLDIELNVLTCLKTQRNAQYKVKEYRDECCISKITEITKHYIFLKKAYLIFFNYIFFA